MAIQLAEIQKWPGPPFDYHEYAPELWEIKKLLRAMWSKLPGDLITQVRWFMFTDRFTEGEIVATTTGTHNRDLRIGLNEISRVFLSALRAESGVGDVLRKFIHDYPPEENMVFDEKRFRDFEARMYNAKGNLPLGYHKT
jgi:hypothetical protein